MARMTKLSLAVAESKPDAFKEYENTGMGILDPTLFGEPGKNLHFSFLLSLLTVTSLLAKWTVA